MFFYMERSRLVKKMIDMINERYHIKEEDKKRSINIK